MRWKNLVLIISFVTLSVYTACGQFFPADNAVLNYRLVPFRFPIGAKTGKYVVEIANGDFQRSDSFRRHIVRAFDCTSGNITGLVPDWATNYTWRVRAIVGKSDSSLHHFRTGWIASLDTSQYRIQVITPATINKDAYFFVDGTRLMYDMTGHPVWYLPDIKGVDTGAYVHLRDMKLSPQGTLTFLLLEDAFEVNYEGKICWRAPHTGRVSGDSIDHVHHEFNRLRNGHYMVLGKEYDYWSLPAGTDTIRLAALGAHWDNARQSLVQRLEFGTIIEYDTAGNVVWSWHTKPYFMNNPPRPGVLRKPELLDAHSNSLYFDEKDSMLYLGFRNISSVLRISYPGGKVMNHYRNIQSGMLPTPDGQLFCFQHSARLCANGSISLFDNNLCRIGAPPRISVFEQPKTGNVLNKVWDFDCPLPAGITQPMQFVAGGNAVELADHSFFVSMYGDFYARVFIVNKDKKITWCVSPEAWNPTTNQWQGFDFYRASVVADPHLLNDFVLGKIRS
jgi:Arylsulfotransferase (ASST)